MEWYLKVLKHYVDFSGRAQRMEFWMFQLINLIVAIVLSVVDGLLGIGLLGTVYALAVLLPNLAVGVRRLHDTGRTGWWLLIGLVPLIGIIVLIVFWVQDSQPEANTWGPNPKAGLAPA